MRVKEAYQLKAEAQLRKWDAQIQCLKDHLQSKPIPSSHELLSLQRLEACYAASLLRLSELCRADILDWEGEKELLEKSMIDLKRAISPHSLSQDTQFPPLQER